MYRIRWRNEPGTGPSWWKACMFSSLYSSVGRSKIHNVVCIYACMYVCHACICTCRRSLYSSVGGPKIRNVVSLHACMYVCMWHKSYKGQVSLSIHVDGRQNIHSGVWHHLFNPIFITHTIGTSFRFPSSHSSSTFHLIHISFSPPHTYINIVLSLVYTSHIHAHTQASSFSPAVPSRSCSDPCTLNDGASTWRLSTCAIVWDCPWWYVLYICVCV